MSIHNLCFGSKIRKHCTTLSTPVLLYKSGVDYEGVYITSTCIPDVYFSSVLYHKYMSCLVGKQTMCIGKNKGADQLRGNREADQCLSFCYTDSTIPLLFKSKISSLKPSSVTAHAALCQTLSKPHCWFFQEVAHMYLSL